MFCVTMSEMSQQDFVRAAQAGDRDAFAPLVHRYEIRVRATCRRFTHDDDDAEDLVLESFVEAYLKLDQLRNPESFGAWLLSITKNHCRSWYRARKSLPDPETLIEEMNCGDDTPNDELIAHGIAGLNAEQQKILDLHYRAGLTYQQIAGDLGVPIGTVMSRIHRAKDALRKAIQESRSREWKRQI